MPQKREELYQHIIDNLNDAVYIYNPAKNRFTSINPAGERLVGHSRSAFLRLPIQRIIAPEYLALVKRMISQKATKDIATIYEIEIIRKDGARVPVEISSRATHKNGSIVEILGIARDISERKQIEKQKEIFLSLITHELKNPLASIKLYADLLKKSEKDPKKQEYFTVIQNQINALTILMDDFLEVSNIRVGRFSIEKERFNLDQVIVDAIATFESHGHKHKIQRRGRADIELLGDKNRIRQVLVNLISNAIKYSPGANKVVVSVKNDESDVTVQVRDFGVGIKKEDYEKVFELFYRTAHAEKDKIKGHGLGLFITREIIKSHNGKIWVKSIPGSGSSFYFTLPLKKRRKKSR